MANKEHLEILKKGVDEWNRWRKSYPTTKPDLTGAYLSESSLEWVAPNAPPDLGIANFRGADFTDAQLSYSVLKGADLRVARLVRADLTGANLRKAGLGGADLRAAKLYETNLTLASFVGANLEGAIFWETVLARVNFTEALGLESCRHGGPSIIDDRTLRRSGGLPEHFLRGCGLPDSLIEFLPSLRRKTVQYYDCFISYSTKDQEFADLLYSQLQHRGVRAWLATENLDIGDRFREKIEKAIGEYDKLVLVLSRDSVESPWVEAEVEAAFEKERRQKRIVLFPIRLDDVVMETDKAWAAAIRRTRQIGDFQKWEKRDEYQKAFGRLMRSLKAEEKDKE